VHDLAYPALGIGDGVAQTKKHGVALGALRQPFGKNQDPITARIGHTHGDGTVRVDVDWARWTGCASGTEDALDLARRCVQEWKQFFAVHGLNP
ncbi:hypothetical protein MRAB57_28, partial [Mycobacterium rhizamassiliense]|jgi:hypothetical protein